MCDDEPGFNDGGVRDGGVVAVVSRDGWPGMVHGRGPVPEPEVARASRRRWRRWIGAWRGARGATPRFDGFDDVGVLCAVTTYRLAEPDDVAAARLAAAKIDAARQQVRLDFATERLAEVGDCWRLLPEHLAIAATLMLTLGNAAWHYMA